MSHECSPTASSSACSSHPICSEPMDLALKSHFGFSRLRRYQKETIDNIFSGKDCLVVMATGAGKSMCYQLPPLVSQKTAIVVSPLLSLMQDQVMSLNKRGINADYLGSTQSNKSVSSSAENGLYDVLFLTPEKAMSLPKRFWEKITSHGVCLFAVDEAHCISEWGPDFRQDYKTLHELRVKLPGVPFLALTATATERVREDIIQSLNLDDPFISIGSFDRPNIFYSVNLIKGSGRVNSFLKIITKDVQRRFLARESTIIYCATIRDTQEVHDALNAQGITCAMYHGQLNRFSREKAHKSFVANEALVMVATIAFGMGIDKPDVRCVIHFGCPKSLESYYQESGRCGRDGLPSSALLYYSRTDFLKGDFYIADVQSETQKDAIMTSFIASQKYCMIGSCRRMELLNYFGEQSLTNCGNCDNCTNTASVQKDLYEESVLLLTSIHDCGGDWGINMPINVLRGSKANKIIENEYHHFYVHGKGKSHSTQWWKCLASILVSNGFIEDTCTSSHRTAKLTKKGEKLILANEGPHSPLIFTLPKEMVDEDNDSVSEDISNETAEDSSNQPLFENNAEFHLYNLLMQIRQKLAEESSIPPHDVCCDEVIISIARTRPSNQGALYLIEGVTPTFVNSFGAIFLYHLKEFCEERKLAFDAFDFECFDTQPESSVIECSNDGSTYEGIIKKIRSLVSSKNGISSEEIVDSFPVASKDGVLHGLLELETSLEIYSKNGFYYTM